MSGHAEQRKIGTTAVSKKGNSKSEHPLGAFRRLLKDFQNGIASLSRLTNPKDKKQETVVPLTQRLDMDVPVSGLNLPSTRSSDRSGDQYLHNHYTTSPAVTVAAPTSREPVSGRDKIHTQTSERNLVERTHTRHDQRTHRVDRTIREFAVQPQPKSMTLPEWRPGGMQRRVVDGATREAHLRFLSGAQDPLYRMPSAARLAQVLRAEHLMKNGEVRPHPQVLQMAHLIRTGGRRAVADMEPRSLERILHQAVGGPQKAKQLLMTPEVSRLVDRHATALYVLEKGISERAATARRDYDFRMSTSGPGARGRARAHSKVTQHSPAQFGNPVPNSAASNMTSGAIRNSEHEMTPMLNDNEEPHDRAMAADITRMIGDTSAAPVQSSQQEKIRLPSVPARPRPMATGTGRERAMAAGVSAAPKASTRIETNEESKRSSGPGGRGHEIKGTLDLVMNGQKAGEAKLRGSMS